MAVSDIRLCWDTNLFRNFYWNIRHWSARSYSLGSYMVRCTGLHTKAFCCVLNESFFNILFGAQWLEAGGGKSMGGKNWCSYAAPEFSQRRANTEPWSTGSRLPQRGGRTEVQVPHRISFCIGLWNVSVPGAQNARFQRTGLPKGADDMALSRSSAATQGDLVGVQWPVPPRWIGDSFLIPGSSAVVWRIPITVYFHVLPSPSSSSSSMGFPKELSHVRHETYSSYHSAELSVSVMLSAFCEPSKSKGHNYVFTRWCASRSGTSRCGYLVNARCYLLLCFGRSADLLYSLLSSQGLPFLFLSN